MKCGMARSRDEAKGTTRAGFRAWVDHLRRWEQENGYGEKEFENITEAMQFRPCVSADLFQRLSASKTASADQVYQFSSDNVAQTLAIVIGGKALSEDAPRVPGIGDSLTKQLLRLGDSFTVWSFGRTDEFVKTEPNYRHFAGGSDDSAKYFSCLGELFSHMHQWLEKMKSGKALIFDVIAPTNDPGDGAKAMLETDKFIDVLRTSFDEAQSRASSSEEDARRRVFLIGTNTYMASVPKEGYSDHCRKHVKYHDYVCCKMYQALTRVEVMLPARANETQVTSIWSDTVGDAAETTPLADMLSSFNRLLKTYVHALADGSSSAIEGLPKEFNEADAIGRCKLFDSNLYVARGSDGGEVLAYGDAKIASEIRRMRFHGPQAQNGCIKLSTDFAEIPAELCFLDRMALLMFEDSCGDQSWLMAARRAGAHAAERKFTFGLTETIQKRRFPIFQVLESEKDMSISELVRLRAESQSKYPCLSAAVLEVKDKDALVQKVCAELMEEAGAKDYEMMRKVAAANNAKDSTLSRLDDAMAELEFSTSNFFWTLLYCTLRPEWMMSTALGAHFHLLSAMQLVADSREELGESQRSSVFSSAKT